MCLSDAIDDIDTEVRGGAAVVDVIADIADFYNLDAAKLLNAYTVATKARADREQERKAFESARRKADKVLAEAIALFLS